MYCWPDLIGQYPHWDIAAPDLRGHGESPRFTEDELSATPQVMLADVVDYGRWRFGTDQGGTYFALYGMIQKLNIGIGAGAGLALAGAFGFDATVAKQTPGGLVGLFLSLSVMPAVCYLISAVMIWRFPINQKRQKVIVKAIERRERRRAAAAFEAPAEVAP